MHPLDGIRAKIARGEEHVALLNREIGRLFDGPFAEGEHSPTFHVRREFHPEDETFRVVISAVDEIPPKIGTIVGDAVHCFRSALDQLVFDLAFIDTGGQEVETTAFPASHDIDNFRAPNGRVQRSMLRGLTKRHRAMFKRFQPYRTRKVDRTRHFLTFLDNFSNDDKHRLLQPLLVSVEGFRIEFPPNLQGRNCYIPATPAVAVTVGDFIGKPLEPETEILRAPIVVTGSNPEMPVQCVSTSVVGLRDGTSIQGALEAVMPFVREIVDTFAPEFETRKALRVRDLPRFGRFPPSTEPRRVYLGIVAENVRTGQRTPVATISVRRAAH